MEEEVLNKYKKAGEIVAECLERGQDLIEPGASVLEVCDKVEEKIRDMGGKPAFPAQISKNEVAAHACPDEDDEEKCEEGDLIKLDVGVHIDGYVADSAVTVDLGDNDELLKASEEALQAALEVVEVGVSISDIGKEIQDVIEGYGYAPVRNLSGHGLARYTVHQSPNIPNYESGADFKLKEDMVIAIEPFASAGAGVIYESKNPTVFQFKQKKSVRNRMARKLLKDIRKFQGLPFTTRWLSRKHSKGKVKLGLRELMKKDVIEDFPPLIDKDKGLISQAEHTVIVKDDPIVTTRS